MLSGVVELKDRGAQELLIALTKVASRDEGFSAT